MDTVVGELPTCLLTAVSGARVDSATGWTVVPGGREPRDRFVSTGVTSVGRSISTLRPAAASDVSDSDAVTTSGGGVGGFAADDRVDEPVDCDDPVVDLVDESAALDKLAEEPPLTPVDLDESPCDVAESVDVEFADDDPDSLEGSADATPCPNTTAAPSPKATAKPAIRPAFVPTPMGDERTRARPVPERIAPTASPWVSRVSAVGVSGAAVVLRLSDD